MYCGDVEIIIVVVCTIFIISSSLVVVVVVMMRYIEKRDLRTNGTNIINN